MTYDYNLSVVTGTYNRLPYVKQMLDSVRLSVGVGPTYEVVLVDGGSTDGTIEWAKSQHDVQLIEQGELLGAIKAFNAGAYAARGRYVVMGNDDILYEDETLLRALAFMVDNPNVGVGCFYQDRDHPGRYDLQRMPAVLNGQQVQHIYGQVCIVPKWLGDEVGWWGSFPDMRTYGGDNNLSCFILEAGYKVEPIPCACIKDLQVQDELRRINNADQIAKSRHRGGHPDSNAWGRHWSHRNGTTGPVIKSEPQIPNPLKGDRKVRFLYLPIYEQGHEIQKRTKRGLRDALARYGMVYEYDWLQEATKGGKWMLDYVMDIMDAWQPDVMLTQIHSPDDNMFNYSSVRRIRSEFPKMRWVNWNGDYHPEDLLRADNIAMAKEFDLQCVVTTQVRQPYSNAGVSWMYWQIGYEESDAEPNGSTPRHDVVFLANGYSGQRLSLGRMLRTMRGVNVGVYGSWSAGGIANGSNLYDFDAGQRLYRAAKVSIGDHQWGDDAVGFVSNRLFQALAAGGALLLHQRVPGLEDLLGLKDGEHYIVWRDLGDLHDKVLYWINPVHEDERKAIADAGSKFVRDHHSFDSRVQELMGVLW